jgi:hypothetical protein
MGGERVKPATPIPGGEAETAVVGGEEETAVAKEAGARLAMVLVRVVVDGVPPARTTTPLIPLS